MKPCNANSNLIDHIDRVGIVFYTQFTPVHPAHEPQPPDRLSHCPLRPAGTFPQSVSSARCAGIAIRQNYYPLLRRLYRTFQAMTHG